MISNHFYFSIYYLFSQFYLILLIFIVIYLIHFFKHMEQNSQISSNDSSDEIIDLKSQNIQINIDKSEEPKEEKIEETKKEIGNNLIINICGKKKILGISDTLPLLIFIILLITILYILFIISTKEFYHFLLFIFIGIFYFFTIYYMICGFLIEPGIIPRNHPNFQKEKDDLKKEIKNELIKELNEEKKEINLQNNNNKNEKEDVIKSDNDNNNNNNELENEKDYDKLTEEIIPSIFTERKCRTCNIFRPPKSSHCRYCDNCVLNFDHHCYYIANCVGFRNHKVFYLFLLNGTILGILLTTMTIYHIIYIYFFSGYPIWMKMYEGNSILMIFSIGLILISFLYICIGSRNLITLIPCFIGLIFIIFLFYNYIDNVPKYINPFTSLISIGILPLTIFSSGTFIFQTNQIMNGYTVKQSNSIKHEFVENLIHKHKNISNKYFRKISLSEKISNWINFFKINRDESLINN